MKKTCKTCKTKLDISNYYIQNKESGNIVYNPNCIECVKKISRKWVVKNNNKRQNTLREWRLLNRKTKTPKEVF